MRRRCGFASVCLAAAAFVWALRAQAQQETPAPAAMPAPRPNIIFIMADDLGYADLGYRGGRVKTPAIDMLAKEGVRLESYYGQQLCTPSRAALMTGRYPMRMGLQTGVIFPSHAFGLPLGERTLPQALREAGYATLMTGKWHLGHADRRFWPQNRGFDHFYGNVLGEVDYFSHERGGVIDWQRDGKFVREQGYYTTLIGDEAVRLIGEQSADKPFFLYFASLAPHAPYQVPQSYLEPYKDVADPQKRAYFGMIAALDEQVGRIVATLERKGLRDNTIILFSSDNGGALTGLFASGAISPQDQAHQEGAVAQGAAAPASNAPLRGGKGSLLEGGVRVPAFVNWPGRLAPRAVTEPLHMVDVMPTLLALAGAKGSADHPFDGRDMWPTLTQGAPSPHEDILINVEAFRGALRKGDWKLLKVALLPGRTELFNVAADPGETTDLAQAHPEIVADLEARLLAYAREQKPSEWIKAQPAFVGAQGKTVFDPDFDVDDGGLPQERAKLPTR